MAATPDTLLVIGSDVGEIIASYSARGLTQTLDPIDASAALARTVNGALIDLSPAQFRKYKSHISCSDLEAPALDGLWPGMVVTVDCVAELGYATATGSPSRPVVESSQRVSGAWTYYRPRLTMRVMEYTVSRDEYGHQIEWTLSLEEV
ncbi:MAG TPA: hypothetical protein VHM22_18565 [Bradyrhizobium sp.]|jgi:hypothetical protein|nr:hypothetical protein [Bradyrhizobium sp.]